MSESRGCSRLDNEALRKVSTALVESGLESGATPLVRAVAAEALGRLAQAVGDPQVSLSLGARRGHVISCQFQCSRLLRSPIVRGSASTGLLRQAACVSRRSSSWVRACPRLHTSTCGKPRQRTASAHRRLHPVRLGTRSERALCTGRHSLLTLHRFCLGIIIATHVS